MSFLADQVIGEARRRQVRLWVDPAGGLQHAGPAEVLDARFLMLLRTQAKPIAARLGQEPAGRWFKRLAGDDTGALLYLIPAAGAGPGAYRSWSEAAPAGLRVEAVLTPGREERFNEAPFTDVAALADRIAEQILAHADRPFAVFGHSTGALVAREVTRRLAASTSRQRTLFVAGALPPHLVGEEEAAGDEELLSYLAAWQGTPAELMADPEFLRAFLPTLRADLKVFHSCRRTEAAGEQVAVDLVALGGLQDDTAPVGHCEAWRRWAGGRFAVRMVPGGHFFPVGAAAEVTGLVAGELGVAAGAPEGTKPVVRR
ncbi:thioesterase II family protein [Streptomyces sp. NPDC018055]|uniref:thioesterase II family protein n=1 Tax=Streptomyces sp. NPDC018055 TaxID=3365038 RepID=UPI00378A06AF